MNYTLDIARSGYYSLINDGLSSIEINDTTINMSGNGDEVSIIIKLELKNYSTRSKIIVLGLRKLD